MDEVKVYAELDRITRVCEYGEKHDIKVISVKKLYDTGNTYTHDNGYYKSTQPVYVDKQERYYFRCETIDYHGNIYYLRLDDGGSTHFRPYRETGLTNAVRFDKV